MKDKLYGVLAPVKKYGLFVAIGILALLPMVVSKTYGSTAQLLRQALSNHPSGRKP